MALRAILQGAAARHRAACRATGPTTLAAHLAAAAPWSTPSLLGALPLGHLPTRVLSFPSQQVQVKVHVAAAFPSTAGEEGKTGRVDADKPGIRDARKPATKLDLWELKELVRSERATISTEIKRHTRLINNMIKEHRFVGFFFHKTNQKNRYFFADLATGDRQFQSPKASSE